MTEKDKSSDSKIPAIRELQKDEIDSVSGGTGARTTDWINPDIDPVQEPKTSWINPNTDPKR